MSELPAWVHPPNETWSGPKGSPNERDVSCPLCGEPMCLRWSKTRQRHFYGCPLWPDCDGVVGCHPDGTPLAPGQKMRSAKSRAASVLEQLYEPEDAPFTFEQAYEWLSSYFGMPLEYPAIHRLTDLQCEALVAALLTEFDIEP